MDGYLTSRCASCDRWCNDGYNYGCLSIDPYSCIHVKRTIRENRTEGIANDGKTVQHSN